MLHVRGPTESRGCFLPMSKARDGFRFTIGQGMALIAALAVLFAIFPMPVAVAFALFASAAYVFRHRPHSKPRVLAAPIGCLFFLIGFPAGIVLAAKLLRASVGMGRFVGTSDLTVLAVTVSGSLAAIVAGAVGYFLGAALSGWLFHDDDASKSRLDEVQAELAWVTQVLEQPEASDDAEVSVKLAAYRVKLEHQLEVLRAGQSDETSAMDRPQR